MFKPLKTTEDQVYGLDFTSTPRAGKPITVARGFFDENILNVTGVDELTSWDQFDAFLGREGEWLAAIDFPFAQPRKLIENLGWPSTWNDCTEFVSTLTKHHFVQILREYQASRNRGDKRHFRVVDTLAGSCSPMQLDFVPVGQMFFEGAPQACQERM